MADDPRLFAPATARNRDPILHMLRTHLPPTGTVLEIASGTGEHIACFAGALPHLHWQPSDPNPSHRASIDAWNSELANVRPALPLDATTVAWPIHYADAVLCINMIHIAPWHATEGLIAGAARILPHGNPLILYGPFRRTGHLLEPSNAAFDRDLRQRDPAWGLRALDTVALCAKQAGFAPPATTPMPANNLMVLFRRHRA